MSSLDKTPKRKKQEDGESLKKTKVEEVTGVSRSGRVRKKSSKLTDFESPDDLDNRFKRSNVKPFQRNSKMLHDNPKELLKEYDVDDHPIQSVLSDFDIPISDPESDYDSNLENENSNSIDSDARSEDPDIVDEVNDIDHFEGIPQDSLYLFEQSKKKNIVKEGKIVIRAKAHRKDKGKSRFTAYMLWAKGVRNQLIHENPLLDFSAVSKKLGELWSSVPNNEKYNWRRRAKRMTKGNDNKLSGQTLPSQFLNKSKSKQGVFNSLKSLSVDENNANLAYNSDHGGKSNSSNGMFKVTGSQPLDIAAHLKLLGESLSIIGERLKEHEGQIAVSGSLSVLLDSLLCSLGPLVCLTQQLPELENQGREVLTEMLDNIAYVMPGL